MLTSLKIQNFRGFRNLEINDLGAVNIIGGRNNAGKTSLLEAIALLSSGGNAAKVLKPQILRLPSYASNAARALEAFIEQLFHKGFLKPVIKVGDNDRYGQGFPRPFIKIEDIDRYYDEKRVTLKLSINKLSTDRQSVSNLFPDTADMTANMDESLSENTFYNHALHFDFTYPEKKRNTFSYAYRDSKFEFSNLKSFLWIEGNKIRTSLSENAKPLFASTFLKSGDSGDGLQYAQQLADLRWQKDDDVVLDSLKIIEPRLKSVSDISLAGKPLIAGDIGSGKLVPLAAMGKGMNQIAHIIFQIVSAKGGVVLIEEVESGFHYSVLADVWKAIDNAASYGTQIFATTHSRECVLSAHEALKPERLRYHRLEQIDGEIRCRTYSPDILKSAFKFNFEVR